VDHSGGALVRPRSSCDGDACLHSGPGRKGPPGWPSWRPCRHRWRLVPDTTRGFSGPGWRPRLCETTSPCQTAPTSHSPNDTRPNSAALGNTPNCRRLRPISFCSATSPAATPSAVTADSAPTAEAWPCAATARARPSTDTGSPQPSPATWPAPAAPSTSSPECCCTPTTKADGTPGTSRCAPGSPAPWTTSAGCGPALRKRSAPPGSCAPGTTHTRFLRLCATGSRRRPGTGSGDGPRCGYCVPI
jgi:hypothetical protein